MKIISALGIKFLQKQKKWEHFPRSIDFLQKKTANHVVALTTIESLTRLSCYVFHFFDEIA